eukprot:15364425-Ditylum_brightwellii.AAC.1
MANAGTGHLQPTWKTFGPSEINKYCVIYVLNGVNHQLKLSGTFTLSGKAMHMGMILPMLHLVLMLYSIINNSTLSSHQKPSEDSVITQEGI